MKKLVIVLCVVLSVSSICGAATPVVTVSSVVQRADGSGMVDIDYTLVDADGHACTVSLRVSDDNGSTWAITPLTVTGDVGGSVSPGDRHIVWDSRADLLSAYGTSYRIEVTAQNLVHAPPPSMVFKSIIDQGKDPGFIGEMSKYETTNAQYCHFLNGALADGLIEVNSNKVYKKGNISNSGLYFETYAASTYSQIEYADPDGDGEYTFSVRTRDGKSMDNHPVAMVSWYGAKAFCDYYGFRLPTEGEWRAVADYVGPGGNSNEPVYKYACGPTIDTTKANYSSANPVSLTSYPYTSPVGHYGSYGYGLCDMAGNVLEWTSTGSGGSRVLRGGGWYNADGYCRVSAERRFGRGNLYDTVGFRVCR